MRMKSILSLTMLLLAVSLARAADWPHWRGPHFNGASEETNLPAEWSQTANIKWAADLPGPSAATPVVSGDRVYISSTRPESDALLALCFDRQTGRQLWQHQVASVIRRDTRSTFAAPSPVTDGEIVVFFYGNGPMVAFNPDGEEQWKRNIEEDYGQFAFQWTFSSTPLLYAGKLYLQVLQRDVPARGYGLADRENESYLLALDPKTGRELWRQVRPSDAYAESREAFTSPIPYEYQGARKYSWSVVIA